MLSRKLIVLCLYIISSHHANSIPVKSEKNAFTKVYKECASSYSLTCFKLDLASWVDRMDQRKDLTLFSGISVVKENSSAVDSSENEIAEVVRAFPDDPYARVDEYLMKKVQGFLNSHSLKFNLLDGSLVEEGRGKGGGGLFGGGGKGQGGSMGAIVAMGMMMKGMILSLGLAGLTALAGKAVMTSVISLLLSAIIATKIFAGHHHGGGHEQSKYIYSPVHHESGGYGGQGMVKRSVHEALPKGLDPYYDPA